MSSCLIIDLAMLRFDGRSLGWLVPAAIVAYLFIALYVYAPLKIRRNQVKRARELYTPIELPQLPTDVSGAFYVASPTLQACGFHALGHLRHHVGPTGQDSFVSIWVNAALNDSAQIIGICTPSSLASIKAVTLVTFRTEFSDDTSIVTSNTSSLGVFPRDPKVSAIRCPGVRDLALLYRFHRARVERDRNGRQATLQRVKDPVSRMQSEHAETYERLVKAGYYTLNGLSESYVPTLKGAYLMTYRLLPPFKQIQRIRRNALANRTLRQLGFGGLETFRQSQSLPDQAHPTYQAPQI